MNKFKSITGWEDRYAINELGVIKSLPRISIDKIGRSRSLKGKVLSYYINHDGYKCIKLYKPDTIFTTYVHRLIALHFIANPENKPQVNHKDGNKLNNSIDNLEWCTQSENELHSYKVLGKKPSITMKGMFGKLNAASKPLYQYDMSGNLIKTWESLKMATDSGFEKKSIYLVIKGVHHHHKGYVWKR